MLFPDWCHVSYFFELYIVIQIYIMERGGSNVNQFTFKPLGKESTEVRITQKMEKERENSYRKIYRSPDEIHIQTQTHGNVIYFGNHRCLSLSEENKATRVFLTWRHHYRMFAYIYSLLIEKGICNCWNISSFHVHCVWLSSRNLSFFGKNFPFLFLFIQFIFKSF